MISMRNTFVLVYTVLSLMFFGLCCFHFLQTKEVSMLKQSQNYITIAAQQTAKNVCNYCDLAENQVRFVYDDPKLAAFYPEEGELTAEEHATADRLTELLVRASYISDYCDLGVIYSNGASAGIISDGTRSLFGQDMYGRAENMLLGRDECWSAFFSGSLSRACFLKRLNSEAVFICSFYSTKLGSTFNTMTEKSRLSLCVTDRSNRVIYGTDNMTVSSGDRLPADLISGFDDRTNITIAIEGGACCCVELENGWRLYSTVYSGAIGEQKGVSTENFIIIISLSTLILFVLIGMIISSYYTSDKRTKKLIEEETDPDTGVLSAFYCEERISDIIETSLVGGTWAFTLVKIKDAEMIRERLGEEFFKTGQIILAEILRDSFGEEAVIGLNLHDEFVVFTDFSDYDLFKAHKDLRDRHEDAKCQFLKLLVGENADYKLYAAMGTCIYPDHGKDYDELEYNASLALAKALEESGDSFVCFDEKLRGGEGS